MKTIFVLLLLCATAWAAPQKLPADAEIISDERTKSPSHEKIEDVTIDDDGNFTVRFISEDGTTVQEEGIIVENDSAGSFRLIVKKGFYSYTSEDGVPVELVYDANNPGEIIIDE